MIYINIAIIVSLPYAFTTFAKAPEAPCLTDGIPSLRFIKNSGYNLSKTPLKKKKKIENMSNFQINIQHNIKYILRIKINHRK